jgi:aminoglycoside phosphotransferase (APT) family kinase protein
MPEWSAEIELDEAGVRALLEAQFPSVSLGGLVPFAIGWDNALWVTGEGIAFRFPRRAIAIAGVEREIAALPALAPLLPLPIPVPEWVGTPSETFPWPFFGARLLTGREIADVEAASGRAAFGASLGGFLRVLHAPGVLAAIGTGLRRDPMGRADMATRVPRTRERLQSLASAGLWVVPPSVDRLLDAAAALGPAQGAALVHGDLHRRHVLVDGGGVPSGVIDWGDLCVADPAVDLALYWSVLDGPGRMAFRAAYGDSALPEDRLLRARVLALFLDAALAAYAHDTGHAALLTAALAGLNETLDG